MNKTTIESVTVSLVTASVTVFRAAPEETLEIYLLVTAWFH